MSELRDWQADASGRLLQTPGDFLAVATPGAGKTRFALTVAMRLMERGEIERVIVVVPTAHLRKQWAEAAAELGLKLDSRIANRATGITPGMDGAVITFSMAAGAPLVWQQIAAQSATLVILDEIHHCGDKLTWGPAINAAFGSAARRLLLSGTPFRSDRTAIPFVRYNSDGLCVPDYEYDYGAALAAGGVVRPVQFHALDGDMTWRSASRVMRGRLSAASERSASAALTSAYDPDGSWIRSVFAAADAELSRHRESTPDAGGLVLAADQKTAEEYRGVLEAIAGEKPALAISNDPDSSKRIEEFAASSARWMIAVQMVAEGVDIPRLEVGVYASRVKTEMFFRQAVGRFVRMRGLEDKACATLFIPSVRVWLGHAQRIERTVGEALRDEPGPGGGGGGGGGGVVVEAVESSDASLYATLHGGESFSDAELLHAESVASVAGLAGTVTAVQMARALRLAGIYVDGAAEGAVRDVRGALDGGEPPPATGDDVAGFVAHTLMRGDTVDGSVPLAVLARAARCSYPSLATAARLRDALHAEGVRTTKTELDPSELPYTVTIPVTGVARIIGIINAGEPDYQLQYDALVNAGCGRIYVESASSRAAGDRRGLAAALRHAVRPGDTLVAWRLAGISREPGEVATITEDLGSNGVALKILSGELAGSYSADGDGAGFAALMTRLAEFDDGYRSERVAG